MYSIGPKNQPKFSITIVTNWNPTKAAGGLRSFSNPEALWKFTNQTIIGYIPIGSPFRMVKSLYVCWILSVG
jgi:hypothetical protein